MIRHLIVLRSIRPDLITAHAGSGLLFAFSSSIRFTSLSLDSSELRRQHPESDGFVLMLGAFVVDTNLDT
jgi:hypothetical protein